MDLLVAVVLLIMCYYIGKHVETKHYKNIKERELKLYKHPYISFSKNINRKKPVKNVGLVSASVVIGCDHFKSFIASLRNLFGGNISAYESVLDRGRREAILRIREQACKFKADLVMNIKIETTVLSPIYEKNTTPQICITAYGTAIEYVKQ